MSRPSPTSISERRLRRKLVQEATKILEKPSSIGQFLKNFNFMVENGLLRTKEPKDKDIFFWKQKLSSFKKIPTDSKFFKARYGNSRTTSSLHGKRDKNKVFILKNIFTNLQKSKTTFTFIFRLDEEIRL